MNKIILLLAFLFSSIEGRSQELTNLGLGVMKYKDTSNTLLLKQLRSAKEDSTKVKLLIRICSYYWRRGSDDSIIYFSKQALKLSKTLQYKSGYQEACFLQCKINAKKGNVTQAKTFLSLVPKDQQARLLLVLGENFLFLPGEKKSNLDSAYKYLLAALSLSEIIQNLHWKQESLIALGKYYFSAGEFNEGKESFLKVIRYHQKNGDKRSEARWWYDLAIHLPVTDSTYAYVFNTFGKALQLYKDLNDTSETAEVMYDIAGVFKSKGRYDSAKNLLTSAISLLKAAQKKRVYKFYLLMSNISQLDGDLNDALFYALETIKNIKATGTNPNDMSMVYYYMGEIYASLGQHENSMKYFISAKDNIDYAFKYNTYAKITEQLLQLQRPGEALKLLLNFENEKPPVRLGDKETMAGAKADCYFALRKYDIAEKYYLQMISLDVLAQRHTKKVIFSVESISGPAAYYKIGKFYVEQKKYAIAKEFLARSLQIDSFDDKSSYSTNLLRNIKRMQFKADSATGNYLSALQNFQQYTAIDDSMFNSERIKQAEKMRVVFETKEKEKDIQLLQKEKLIQQGSLKQATFSKNVAIADILLLAIILGLLYRQFRLKQLTNQTISHKNEVLEHLLTEKEWLLKEVHHRVKNNLQIMISLLNTQSNYVESNDAVTAIRESQERMQAISLIHQKLYNADETAYINIKEYTSELVEHIRNGFSGASGIVFNLNITDYQMDVAQAVPLGLILNEAISNIFKYAFPGGLSGIVNISLTHSKDDHSFLLTISDNGAGFDQKNYDLTKKASFGLRLMQGLSKQIGGSFKIENNNGVVIQVAFGESKETILMRSKSSKITIEAV
ncbi:histidine kinase dimerization/phosphoacceptor domain -containing protein [Lacibacter sediminis]|uniref:histidine kinase n=1 Tax=Lacibacter sediminis TaxID=2760713 RepID=A0A7G5XK72_9BACT|nr:histidine kinase dimerization/phosphoacceptor domain -containing protein [Lacibacter sediminis]QNA45875.1 hypothetical protein H4075_06700 [Lacibacter sediminis]